MVLAEGASQIASEAARGEDQAAGAKAAQGLFLNGVQGQTGQLPVIQRNDSPLPAAPGPAEAGLALLQLTVVEAQLTGHAHVCRTTSNRSRA